MKCCSCQTTKSITSANISPIYDSLATPRVHYAPNAAHAIRRVHIRWKHKEELEGASYSSMGFDKTHTLSGMRKLSTPHAPKANPPAKYL